MPVLTIEYSDEEDLLDKLRQALVDASSGDDLEAVARRLAAYARETIDGIDRLRLSVCPDDPVHCPFGEDDGCRGGGHCEQSYRAAYDYAWTRVKPGWIEKAIELIGLSPKHILRFWSDSSYTHSVATLSSRLEEVLERTGKILH